MPLLELKNLHVALEDGTEIVKLAHRLEAEGYDAFLPREEKAA